MKQFNQITYILCLIILDFLFIYLVELFVFYLRNDVYDDILIGKYIWINFILIFFLLYEKIYMDRFDFWRETKKIYKAVFYSFIAVFTILSLTKFTDDYSRSYIFLFIGIVFLTFPFFKRIVKNIIFRFDFFKQNVKVIAKGKDRELLHNELRDNWYFGYKPALKEYSNIIVYSKNFTTSELNDILDKYSSNVYNIYLIPYLDHFDFSHTQVIDFFNIRISAFQMQNRLLNYKNIMIKLFVEKILTILIFPFILLLHVFICFLIKNDSEGNILFKQKRLGKDEKLFSCYKYRTMFENSEELLNQYLIDNPKEIEYYNTYHKYTNDPRITKVGKFLRKTSLDEIPQFFNVLRADMNLIGPRPYMVDEKSKIDEDIIFCIKPGITGLWQVSGRNELTFKERLELDKWYIQNWSLWMDFVIFIKTIKVVFSKVGAK